MADNSEETRRLVDGILNNSQVQPMPDLVVDDNPKAKKYADIIISQLNKRCGWNTYHTEAFVEINGKKSILFLNAGTKNAVAFTPTSNDNNTVLYYFKNYHFYGTNTAELTVDGGKFGIIQSLSILFDYIKNPNLYKTQISESMVYEKDDWDRTRAESTYYSSADGRFQREFDNFINGGDKHQIRNITPEGVNALAEEIKKRNLDPIYVLKEIMNGTNEGDNFRRLLGDPIVSAETGRRTKTLDAQRYVIALKYICKTIGGDIKTDTEVTVTETPSESLGDWIYNGVDVNFLKRCGIDIKAFEKVANEYQATLDNMEKILRAFVDYARASRIEKLNNPKFRGLIPALFVSGIGGIGKSNTWKKVKSDTKLNVRKGFDYAERGSAAVLPQEVYKFIYDNNGKLLVFDDTPDLFSSSYAPSFWKAALTMPSEDSFVSVQAPKVTGGNYYKVEDCMIGGIVSAKKRYEKECPIEKPVYKSGGMTPEERAKIEAENKTVYTPNEIPVMSKFLFIVNESEKDMETQLGAHWDAIKSRTKFMVIAPPPEVLWAKIKGKILETQDDPQKAWVPKEYVNEVITFVEDLILAQEADKLSFRGFGDGSLRWSIENGEDWKHSLKSQLGATTLSKAKLR